ncbi:efflux RND transporter permease subunit [Pantoea septica]|uniref:efflux RND transporter permease subunit n=1 Tax=Pantoea septica TaxID=472695 RepID=UPI001C10D2BC|nr:efflux RND transporter permease subunit [Pantoea septica]MBU5379405.1 malate:quinone oxidoreductase [Pantoea septica]
MKQGFNLSAWALKQQQLMAFFMLLIMAAGIISYEQLSRNEDPAFTIKTAVVSAQWPGANLSDTVNLVTDTLEKKLQEIPWLDYVQSETHAGRCVIFINLRDNTPPDQVADIWYQVRKKMQDVAPSLPQGVQGPAVNDEFEDTFGTIYGFTADGFTLRELRDRVDSIRRDLMSLPDVGKIQLLGEQEEQLVVAFSSRQLSAMGLDLQQVADALRAQNLVEPAGTARTDGDNIALRVSGAFSSEESLKAVTLRVNNRYIPLTDIASIARRPAEPPAPLFRVNGQPAVGLAVSMAPTGNMLDFGQALRSRMNSEAAQLPHGIEMTRTGFKRNSDNSWHVTITDVKSGKEHAVDAKYVFIGAGGGALKLLQETGIPEAENYAGFPVGGSFLVTENQDIARQHAQKVYGQASVGAPPMSVPHLDARFLDGKRVVLFGPFATFSTKFLKNGSFLDLLSTTTTKNVGPMTDVGLDNFDLVKYLIGQVMLSDEDRFEALKEYYPSARKEDWKLIQAGQRVQIIKKDAEKGGVLKLGTEIVTDKQKTLAALLGASPGASTAAPISINVMKELFPEQFKSAEWQSKIRSIVPSYGQKLNGNVALTQQVWDETAATLQLVKPPVIQMKDAQGSPQAQPQKPKAGAETQHDMAL